MEYYINIHMLPDAEFPTPVLLNAIYTKFHKRLSDLAATDIGVSFPTADVNLGALLRLHGKQETLKHLMAVDWLGGMRGYTDISQIMTVPQNVTFRIVSRKQDNMSQSKLNRLIRRGTIKEHDLSHYKVKMYSRQANYPYVELLSSSNGQRHRRYIEQGQLLEQPIEGTFNQFGLSTTATVPWFT